MQMYKVIHDLEDIDQYTDPWYAPEAQNNIYRLEKETFPARA